MLLEAEANLIGVFTGVLLTVVAGALATDLSAVLLAVLGGVLVAGFVDAVPATRDEFLVGEAPVFRERVLFDAIASMRGAGFLAGIAARTCLTAFVCCSSVIRNS